MPNIITEGQIGDVYTVPYKVYTALLTQDGTSAPVATVLENTIGNIVWSYESVGLYRGTLSNTFLINKTWSVIENNVSSSIYEIVISNIDINYVSIASNLMPGGDITNSVLYNTPVEIRVYP